MIARTNHEAPDDATVKPVFMMVSQSAATAAALAIDDRVSVQPVNYAQQARQLTADGQILETN